MTEIIWIVGKDQHHYPSDRPHTEFQVGDYVTVEFCERLVLLRVELKLVPARAQKVVQLRCVIAAEEVRARIFGETDCETA